MIETLEVIDAIHTAVGVEAHLPKEVDHKGRLLGEWLTCDSIRTKKPRVFRSQLLSFLRDIPEDMSVIELIEAIEKTKGETL